MYPMVKQLLLTPEFVPATYQPHLFVIAPAASAMFFTDALADPEAQWLQTKATVLVPL
jgi:hypothetical protein